MNTKLNFCMELLQLIKSDIGEERGHSLEIIIIILIMVEVIIAFVEHRIV